VQAVGDGVGLRVGRREQGSGVGDSPPLLHGGPRRRPCSPSCALLSPGRGCATPQPCTSLRQQGRGT
jgi:hypothetical protein